MFQEIDQDRAMVDAAYQDMLQSSLRTFTERELQTIDKAYHIAYQAHQGVRRKSGVPYILHPIAVAKIVVQEIGLGYKSVVVALLHDVVEDADYTVEDIELLFDEKVAYLVNGLTKLDNIFDKEASIQVENFKKLLTSMLGDIRVVLIKLADRLHNMRTLGAMAPHKREKIAIETLYLYAPLAHRLGLYNIKSELEDLTLKYQYPAVYDELQTKIDATEQERQQYINEFSAPIIAQLDKYKIKYEISGRVKSLYSIWQKMRAKQIPFEEVYDLFAVRIVFDPPVDIPEKTQCWFIYSSITDIYKPNYDRFRDWITTPKANGYEALHITVMGPQGRWVEVQIRSKRMDEVAERGYAAHWRYKEDTGALILNEHLEKWLNSIREMLVNSDSDLTTFLDGVKLTFSPSTINVFTPKGKVLHLPTNSTVIDFAFEIHTGIGRKAIGGKVNQKLVALSTVLHNGDQVEILTADTAKPQPEWLQFAHTIRAKNLINSYLRQVDKDLIDQGSRLVEEAIRQTGWSPSAIAYKMIMEAYGVESKDELFIKIASGLLDLSEINKVAKRRLNRNKLFRYWGLQLFPGSGKRKEEGGDDTSDEDSLLNKDRLFLIKDETNESDKPYQIASCCHPIPGDEVLGFLEDDDNVMIHKKNCVVAQKEASQHGDRIVNAHWTEEFRAMSFLTTVNIEGLDRQGLFLDVLEHISKEYDVNIKKIHAEAEDGVVQISVAMFVHSLKQLTSLMSTISKVKGINSVKRVDSVGM